jgi:hypothetical protein
MDRRAVALFLVLTTGVVAAAPKFVAVWKAADVSRLNFLGKKVAALVITDDQSLQMSGEEALNRELTARGVNGLAAYRIIPREELKSAEKAKGWFERAGIDGVVALRPVSRDTERTYTPAIWSSSYYQTFWGYYGYGWSGVYVPGSSSETTTIVVETLIFSVPQDRLLWAATSETKNPKQLQSFVKDLVTAAAGEMKKMKLVG